MSENSFEQRRSLFAKTSACQESPYGSPSPSLGEGLVVRFQFARRRATDHSAHDMSPAKLFDYLDGKLDDWERSNLESQLEKDPYLQKELAAARRIHAGMHGESKEVFFEDPAALERGRKMSLRVGIAFVVLVAVNVAGGLFFIARHEANNPNLKYLADQNRQQLTNSLREASRNEMPPPTLDIGDLTITAPAGQMKTVAENVADLARKADASATIGLPDDKQVNVAIDIAAEKEPQFRETLGALPGAHIPAESPNENGTPASARKSLIVHVVRDDSAK
jgi:hypothetical protein